ncbi:MAG TPA: M20/M25/M40 family metallo-hydrolase [Ilumatobacter sp.]|nr:M20/M25/M40 family metallo-hydrolase [Ilumatobacter sp.]
MRNVSALVVTALVMAGACSGDGEASPTTSAAPTTPSAPVTTATPTTIPTTTATPTTAVVTTVPDTVPEPAADDAGTIVAVLASDEMEGRDDGTPGSRAAQLYLAEQLATFAEPAFPGQAGLDGFVQPGPSANVVGIVRGAELPNEYVVLGAHYDGLGDHCRVLDPADSICNGATDNATGVAAALTVARQLAEHGAPRRSVVVALWDREEDGLRGSADFLAAEVVPPEAIVAYLNWDIQGSNLLPSLTRTSFVIGAETGGTALADATRRATDASSLQYVVFSLVFGQGRSDHANFVAAGVPSVFFTDVTNGCYHTTGDDLSIVDFGRLDAQVDVGLALAADLVDTAQVPQIADAPFVTFADAEQMLALTSAAVTDADLLTSLEPGVIDGYLAELETIVGAGEEAFDEAATGVLLGGAAMLVEALASTACDGYLDAAG